jgi:hypothetical protein
MRDKLGFGKHIRKCFCVFDPFVSSHGHDSSRRKNLCSSPKDGNPYSSVERVFLILWGIDDETWLDPRFCGMANGNARNQGEILQLYGQDLMPHGTPLYDMKRNLRSFFDLYGGTECNPKAHVFLEVAKQRCGYMRYLSSSSRYLRGKPRSLYGNPIACGLDFQRTASPPDGNRHRLKEDPGRFRFHGIRNTALCDVFLSKENDYGRMWLSPRCWHLFHGISRIRKGIPFLYG